MRGPAIIVLTLAVGLVVGALAFGDEPATTEGSRDAAVHRVLFQGSEGDEDGRILEVNGLSMGANCKGSPSGPLLSVWFTTEVDDALTATSFGQLTGQEQSNYTFHLDDFDRSDGRRDLLGSSPNDTTGTFVYSRPDGGQVTITFLADQDTVQGQCVFSGAALTAG